MQQVGCAVRVTRNMCCLEIGDDPTKLVARIRRSLQSSTEVYVSHQDVHAVFVTQPASDVLFDTSNEISTRNDWSATMRQVRGGRQVAYKVSFAAAKEPAAKADVPECIQRVIDKHSGPGGTLCGDIPYGETAKGFEMQIELEPGARPVNVRQYRLTPKEQEALLTKVEEFVARGWIEPSVSAWNSPVLFVPKPNGSLRFCVDFRFINRTTVKDSFPQPQQSEMFDKMMGANLFSALDLCSGFYQIPLNKASRQYTSFSTPRGLYQWCVAHGAL